MSRGDVIRRTFAAFTRARDTGEDPLRPDKIGAVLDENASDPGIVKQALDGAGGALDEMCDEEPDADECKVFD